ncbi:MAG: hypothetical protein L0G46_06745, partial [Kocuria sp.]|nr:hypothetical protein [Kocuria sp.]
LRIALREGATRDFVRSEIRDLIEELVQDSRGQETNSGGADGNAPHSSSTDSDRHRSSEPRTSILDIVTTDGDGGSHASSTTDRDARDPHVPRETHE